MADDAPRSPIAQRLRVGEPQEAPVVMETWSDADLRQQVRVLKACVTTLKATADETRAKHNLLVNGIDQEFAAMHARLGGVEATGQACVGEIQKINNMLTVAEQQVFELKNCDVLGLKTEIAEGRTVMHDEWTMNP